MVRNIFIYLIELTIILAKKKKVLPIAPGENVLFRHFTRMEDYLELNKQYTDPILLTALLCSHEHYYLLHTEPFFPIHPIQEKIHVTLENTSQTIKYLKS